METPASEKPESEESMNSWRWTKLKRNPMVFSNSTAFLHLKTRGEVYSFRKNRKSEGKVWIRRSRTGEKEFDASRVEVGQVTATIDNIEAWADKSGFSSAEDWLEAIEEFAGEENPEGFIYKVVKQ